MKPPLSAKPDPIPDFTNPLFRYCFMVVLVNHAKAQERHAGHYAYMQRLREDPVRWAAFQEKSRKWALNSYRRKVATKEGREKHRENVNRNRTSETGRASFAAYMRKKRASDPQLRKGTYLRQHVHRVLKFKRNPDLQFPLVGCSRRELVAHIEGQFQAGMTWDNYGKGQGMWCVDHIKPCSEFDLQLEAEQRKCFHFSNLRPLWFNENCSKCSTWDEVAK